MLLLGMLFRVSASASDSANDGIYPHVSEHVWIDAQVRRDLNRTWGYNMQLTKSIGNMICALFLVTGLVIPSALAIDDAALVLYCPFEEGSGDTVTDLASGLVGAIAGAQWSNDGKIGGALEFSAANHLVEFPEDPALDLTEALTMEAWIWPEAVQADANIMGRRTAGNVGGYCMQWNTGKVETWVNIGGWQGTRGMQTIVPEPGEWHHVATVFTGDAVIQYVDGEVDIDFDKGGPIASTPEVFRIGQAQTGLTSMIGLIDEVAVYSRALSQAEIAADMSLGVVPAAVSSAGKLAITWATLR